MELKNIRIQLQNVNFNANRNDAMVFGCRPVRENDEKKTVTGYRYDCRGAGNDSFSVKINGNQPLVTNEEIQNTEFGVRVLFENLDFKAYAFINKSNKLVAGVSATATGLSKLKEEKGIEGDDEISL